MEYYTVMKMNGLMLNGKPAWISWEKKKVKQKPNAMEYILCNSTYLKIKYRQN